MTFDELDKMWHKIREEIAAEDKNLSDEEIVAQYDEIAEEASKRLGLRIVTEVKRSRATEKV